MKPCQQLGFLSRFCSVLLIYCLHSREIWYLLFHKRYVDFGKERYSPTKPRDKHMHCFQDLGIKAWKQAMGDSICSCRYWENDAFKVGAFILKPTLPMTSLEIQTLVKVISFFWVPSRRNIAKKWFDLPISRRSTFVLSGKLKSTLGGSSANQDLERGQIELPVTSSLVTAESASSSAEGRMAAKLAAKFLVMFSWLFPSHVRGDIPRENTSDRCGNPFSIAHCFLSSQPFSPWTSLQLQMAAPHTQLFAKHLFWVPRE